MAELIAGTPGQTVERINADQDRDRWFTAQEALRVRLHRQGDLAAPASCPDATSENGNGSAR